MGQTTSEFIIQSAAVIVVWVPVYPRSLAKALVDSFTVFVLGYPCIVLYLETLFGAFRQNTPPDKSKIVMRCE